MATKKQKQAAEDRRAKMRTLATEIGNLSDAQRQALLDRAGTAHTITGHPLSIHNTLLLASQTEHLSVVGGFRQWKTAGRSVRKGEKGLGIWIPRKNSKPETAEAEEVDEVRFILGTVFDISQTDAVAA